MATPVRLAVVGAGWAGLAAAVAAVQAGHAVTIFEAAHRPGGRARSLPHGGLALDNGQHILIGAYSHTLRLMQTLGVDTGQALLRLPLQLLGPTGQGLRLPSGPTTLAFLRGVWAWQDMPWRSRWALLRLALRWRHTGFRCANSLTVADLCQGAPNDLMTALVEPLCVAALNTSAAAASGQVFLNVLRDALFGPTGSADLLLPRQALSELLPEPAWRWLQEQGAQCKAGQTVRQLQAVNHQWKIDDQIFDQVILATPAREAARLVAQISPTWAASAAKLRHEPIVTVWLQAKGARWPCPMVTFPSDASSPAQFGFDLGALGGPPGLFTLVISAAAASLEHGLEACAARVRQQVLASMMPTGGQRTTDYEVMAVRAEKRATFICSPGLQRPSMQIAPGLRAAGDFVDGPYPATLEGAVRAGWAAATEA
ncbi:MAG: phytoene dehydrogenase [Ideonella sp. MAG2]|nr:MAG: phytoene dehydrogenase [Ideonella sp. MAG2]